MKTGVWTAAVLLACASAAPAQPLPATVVPVHYQLRFVPDFDTDTFGGDETIQVTLSEPTSKITLNAVDISFQEVTVTSGGLTRPATVTTDAATETATLALRGVLPAGPARIRVRFTARLNDELRGLYLSRANNRKYAVTQFEPTDARRAFPCFDQPDMKASFSISVVVDQGDTAISNGRVLSDRPGPGDRQHTLQFSITQKMSPYLVALAVGKFACLEGQVEKVPIRVCATPEKAHLGAFALDAAENILRFYAQYFSVKYPFGKLDLVAAPDFAAGAMENTAAIFFRERDLLLEPARATSQAQKSVAAVIAHEMAHQWFGDLVTMKWWDDLWLNEGFATWMETKPLKAWKPEWQAELDEAESVQEAMAVDGLESTRPIRTSVTTPDEINESFDAIAYEKAGAVLRMVEAYVGSESFRAGINTYLKKHAYGNVTAEDFWTTMAQATSRPVDRIMATFIDQVGVPVVSVSTSCSGDTQTTVGLSQGRFLLSGSPPGSAPPQLWQIPVQLRLLTPPNELPRATVTELLSDSRQNGRLDGCGSGVLANAGAQGYYRTRYAGAGIAGTSPGPLGDALTPVERYSLLADSWALTRAGYQDIGDYLLLAPQLTRDASPQVIDLLGSTLRAIGDEIVMDSDRTAYQAWVRALLKPEVERSRAAVRQAGGGARAQADSALAYTLGYAGRDADVIAEARAAIEQQERDSPIQSAWIASAVKLAAMNGDAALYGRLLDAATTAQSPDDQDRSLRALAAFSDSALLTRTLELALSDQVRSQDTPILIAAVLENPAGRRLAWNFIKARWDQIQKRLGGSGWEVNLMAAAGSACDPDLREDMKQFFGGRVPAAQRTLRQSAERITDCVAFRFRQQEKLARWLKD